MSLINVCFTLFSAETIDATSEFLEVVLSSDAFNVTIISFTLWCYVLHVQLMFSGGGL